MALKIGNNAVANAFVGSSQVRRAYKGGTLVYQGWGPSSEREFVQMTAPGGPAELSKIYGKTIVNNQLLEPLSLTYWRNSGYGSWTYTDDVAHLDFTSTPGQPAQPNIQQINVYSPVVGHIYFVTFLYRTGENNTLSSVYGRFGTNFNLNLSGLSANMPWTRITRIITATNASMNFLMWCYFTNADTESYTVDFYLGKPNIIDLTLLYGEGHEPTSVAQFLADYPEYDPTYDPGSLQSNKTTELRAERIPVINVWDEQWEVGSYNAQGTKLDGGTRIRSKNPIPVSPNTPYYYKMGVIFVILFLDADKRAFGGLTTKNNDQVINTPSDARYVVFYTAGTYGDTYNHDICINLSDPAINGQYFPHWRGSLALNIPTLTSGGVAVFPDGMCRVGSIRDEAEGSTAIKRLGAVNLGDLTYVYDASGTRFRGDGFSGNVASGSEVPVAICAIYTPITGADTYKSSPSINDMTFGFSATEGRIFIRNSNYTDPAAFKTAMAGVFLFFELATPGTYTLDTPLPTDLTCEQGDKLQRVSDNNCPFVGEMKFGL